MKRTIMTGTLALGMGLFATGCMFIPVEVIQQMPGKEFLENKARVMYDEMNKKEKLPFEIRSQKFYDNVEKTQAYLDKNANLSEETKLEMAKAKEKALRARAKTMQAAEYE